jgi:hypothetical protein
MVHYMGGRYQLQLVSCEHLEINGNLTDTITKTRNSLPEYHNSLVRIQFNHEGLCRRIVSYPQCIGKFTFLYDKQGARSLVTSNLNWTCTSTGYYYQLAAPLEQCWSQVIVPIETTTSYIGF